MKRLYIKGIYSHYLIMSIVTYALFVKNDIIFLFLHQVQLMSLLLILGMFNTKKSMFLFLVSAAFDIVCGINPQSFSETSAC